APVKLPVTANESERSSYVSSAISTSLSPVFSRRTSNWTSCPTWTRVLSAARVSLRDLEAGSWAEANGLAARTTTASRAILVIDRSLLLGSLFRQRDLLDDDVDPRAVLVVGPAARRGPRLEFLPALRAGRMVRRNLLDGPQHRLPRHHLAENRVLAVEGREPGEADEELGARAVGLVGPGHGERPDVVPVVVEFRLQPEPRGVLEFSALHHEGGDDPVEDQAVVPPLPYEIGEIEDVSRRDLGEKFQLDVPVVRLQGRDPIPHDEGLDRVRRRVAQLPGELDDPLARLGLGHRRRDV